MLGHSKKLAGSLRLVSALGLTAAIVAGGACACSKAKDGASAAPAAAAAPSGVPSGATAPAPPAAAVGEPAAAGVPAEIEGKPHAEGEGYVIEVKAPADAAAGAEGTAQVQLSATGQYHLNKDFPTVLDVTAPDGVTLGKVKLTTADASKFEEKTATWDVKFTAKDAGEKKFGAKFRFAVCTATTCDPKKEALAWVVPVK
jgi:hypothetical protein